MSAFFFSKHLKKNRKSITSILSQYSLFEQKIELLYFKSIQLQTLVSQRSTKFYVSVAFKKWGNVGFHPVCTQSGN